MDYKWTNSYKCGVEFGITKEFVKSQLGTKNVARFMIRLKDVGMEANYLIRKAIEESSLQKRQFVISMLVSPDEVRNEDMSEIIAFQEHLLNLDTLISEKEERGNECNNTGDYQSKLTCSRRYILKNRICVLLNSPWREVHGEARLLDPNGEFLTELLEKPMNREEYNYLDSMRESFYNIYEDHVEYVIMLFSFNIPCTVPEYMCSKLIGRFVEKKGETVIVAYDKTFYSTNKELALSNMRDSGAYILARNLCRKEVNKEILMKWCVKDLKGIFFRIVVEDTDVADYVNSQTQIERAKRYIRKKERKTLKRFVKPFNCIKRNRNRDLYDEECPFDEETAY